MENEIKIDDRVFCLADLDNSIFTKNEVGRVVEIDALNKKYLISFGLSICGRDGNGRLCHFEQYKCWLKEKDFKLINQNVVKIDQLGSYMTRDGTIVEIEQKFEKPSGEKFYGFWCSSEYERHFWHFWQPSGHAKRNLTYSNLDLVEYLGEGVHFKYFKLHRQAAGY